MNKEELIRNRTPYAYYNLSDMVRIKNHMEYLSNILGQEITGFPTWDYVSVPTQSEFQEILNNIQLLRNKGHILSTTPNVPIVIGYNYSSANNVEQILYDLELLIENVLLCYKLSGTFYSGEGLVL